MDYTLLQILLGSSLVVSLINLIKDLILWRVNRKAYIEDRSYTDTEKLKDLDNRLEKNQEALDNILLQVRELKSSLEITSRTQDEINYIVLVDHLKQKCRQLNQKETLSYSEREELIKLWDMYHDLGGNSSIDVLIKEVLEKEVEL